MISEPLISGEIAVYGFVSILIAVGLCGAVAIVREWWQR